jgi:hypothetical protein
LVVNYVDHDPAAGLLDYEGGTHTYNGHAGTDYTLHNFRLMDRGCPILAAASGTVAYVSAAAPGAFDRSCSFDSWADDGTWVWIDNGDGTYSEYYHLRAWSLTLGPGEAVEAGQMIGLVGSSGYSTAPHLHFETGDYNGGPYAWRDPYSGPANPLPSLWLDQEEYEGDDPLDFVDMGIFSDDAVGGSVFNTTYCDLQEGIHAPVVFGIHEPHLDLWVQFRGNAGDPFRIEVRRPDDTEWAAFDDVLAFDARFDWFWAYWFWDGAVGPGDYGTWRVRALAGGNLSHEVAFEVGPETIYGPRLRPGGRSFRVQTAAQHDTLRLTPLSPAATFTLIGAPVGITLAGPVLTVGTSSSQETRSAFFAVEVRDAAARADTAWYHLVDPTKPLEPAAGLAAPELPAGGLRLWSWPNPSPQAAAVAIDLPQGGATALRLFDASGRLVRTLLDGPIGAGRHAVRWDGRNDSGTPVSSGVYFARVSTPGGERTAKVVLAR